MIMFPPIEGLSLWPHIVRFTEGQLPALPGSLLCYGCAASDLSTHIADLTKEKTSFPETGNTAGATNQQRSAGNPVQIPQSSDNS